MKFGMQLHNNIPQRGFSRNPEKNYLPGAPLPHSKNSNYSFIVRFCLNLKQHIGPFFYYM